MCLCSRESSVVNVFVSVDMFVFVSGWRAAACRKLGVPSCRARRYRRHLHIRNSCLYSRGEAVLCGARWPGRIDMTAE